VLRRGPCGGPRRAFQRGVDVRQRVAQTVVGEPGGLRGEVVVIAGQHGEFGEYLVVGADQARGAGGVGDDVGVAGVGLALARVHVSDPAHRQPGHDRPPRSREVGDGYGQGADRGGLIDEALDDLGQGTRLSRPPRRDRRRDLHIADAGMGVCYLRGCPQRSTVRGGRRLAQPSPALTS
jgi:hypothetical protein